MKPNKLGLPDTPHPTAHPGGIMNTNIIDTKDREQRAVLASKGRKSIRVADVMDKAKA